MNRAIRVAVGMAALAALASQAGAVQLRYKFHAGDAHTYKMTMKGRGETSSSAMPQAMRMEMAIETVTAQKVVSVAEGGATAQVEQRVKTGKLTFLAGGDWRSSDLPQQRMLLTMDTRGRVLQAQATDAQGKDIMGASMQGVDWSQMAAAMAFPEQDLKVNDTWDASGALKMTGMTMQVQSRSRLLHVLTYKGRPCAQIRTAFQIPLESLMPKTSGQGPAPNMQGKIAGELTWYFDHAKGVVVDETGKIQMRMKMSLTVGEKTMDTTSSMMMNVMSALQD